MIVGDNRHCLAEHEKYYFLDIFWDLASFYLGKGHLCQVFECPIASNAATFIHRDTKVVRDVMLFTILGGAASSIWWSSNLLMTSI